MAVKTIIVTGASRGIGRAVAQFLITKSHNVIVTARGHQALQELQSLYPSQVRVLAGDMTDIALGQKAVDLAIQEFGQLDGLVINHGVLPPVTTVANSEIQLWKQNFDVNFFSAVTLVKAGIPHLRRSQGKVIFISSGAAFKGYGAWGAYGASKAALNHLALTLSVEEPNVTSISIRPGVVNTQMQAELRETHAIGMQKKDVAKFFALHKEGKLLEPDQPGRIIASLVLDGAKDLSGKYFNWDDKELANFHEP